VLDYLSDFICCLYGKPGAYGVVTLPFGVRWALREGSGAGEDARLGHIEACPSPHSFKGKTCCLSYLTDMLALGAFPSDCHNNASPPRLAPGLPRGAYTRVEGSGE